MAPDRTDETDDDDGVEVATCPECDTVVEVEWKRGVVKCPECRAAIRNYDRPTRLCPACRQPKYAEKCDCLTPEELQPDNYSYDKHRYPDNPA